MWQVAFAAASQSACAPTVRLWYDLIDDSLCKQVNCRQLETAGCLRRQRRVFP
jgi:hypothetical protein